MYQKIAKKSVSGIPETPSCSTVYTSPPLLPYKRKDKAVGYMRDSTPQDSSTLLRRIEKGPGRNVDSPAALSVITQYSVVLHGIYVAIPKLVRRVAIHPSRGRALVLYSTIIVFSLQILAAARACPWASWFRFHRTASPSALAHVRTLCPILCL